MAQDGNPRRGSLVFPIILITVGALLLFRNWHPGFDPVPILWTYWPLILIFIGVGKIWDNVQRSRSEEHTSELQSHLNLVCRLLLEKKKTISGTSCVPYARRGNRA